MESKPLKPPNFDPLKFSPPPKPSSEPTAEERHALIAQAAYGRAERRQFAPGHELEDWLAAEAEVEQRLEEARARDRGAEW